MDQNQQAQTQTNQNWFDQYEAFTHQITEVPFNAGYKPEEDERFVLSMTELPDLLGQESRQSVTNLDSLSLNSDILDQIKGLAAFVLTDSGEELVLFQNFNRSNVIKPGSSLLLSQNTFRALEDPVISMDGKLGAIYVPTQNKLMFFSFRNTNTYLPLSDFYQQASEENIRNILHHPSLSAEDEDGIAQDASQWFKTRFAMLNDSGILDRYSVQDIKNDADRFGFSLLVDPNQKIVFPADKTEAKKLLQFLNEELYKGPITDVLYETNSKREAE